MSQVVSIGCTCLLAMAFAGCGTYRYRVTTRFVPSSPTTKNRYCLRLTNRNLADTDHEFIRRHALRYPSVFSPDGIPVDLRLMNVNKFNNGTAWMDYPLTVSGFFAAFTLFTLPGEVDTLSARQVEYCVSDGEAKVAGEEDFGEHDEHVLSLVPFLGWLFPFGSPEDTVYYRTSFWDGQILESKENREVMWRFVVDMMAVKLVRLEKELEAKRVEIERKREKGQPAQHPAEQSPIAPPSQIDIGILPI